MIAPSLPSIKLSLARQQRAGVLSPLAQTQLAQIEVACDLVCRAYAVSFEEVIGPRRFWNLVWPRFVIMNLLVRHCPGLGTRRIASLFDREHTLVSYAVKALSKELQTNPSARAHYDQLEHHFLIRINKQPKDQP